MKLPLSRTYGKHQCPDTFFQLETKKVDTAK